MSEGGFSAEWLSLREPFDAAARAHTPCAWSFAGASALPSQAPLRVIDLGCGSGANLRHLAPRLGVAQQHWRMVDHDPALLAHAAATAVAPGITIDTHRCDLARELGSLPFAGTGLVTASALLDLVGSDWVSSLVRSCADAGASVHFALSYDGRTDWSPADPDDSAVLDAFNRHQRTDKGFGMALGPDAAPVTERALRARGYRVQRYPSDWQIGADAPRMLRALIEGIAAAAIAIAPDRASEFDAWRRRRLAPVMLSVTRMRVGHVDLLARPGA